MVIDVLWGLDAVSLQRNVSGTNWTFITECSVTTAPENTKKKRHTLFSQNIPLLLWKKKKSAFDKSRNSGYAWVSAVMETQSFYTGLINPQKKKKKKKKDKMQHETSQKMFEEKVELFSPQLFHKGGGFSSESSVWKQHLFFSAYWSKMLEWRLMVCLTCVWGKNHALVFKTYCKSEAQLFSGTHT